MRQNRIFAMGAILRELLPSEAEKMKRPISQSEVDAQCEFECKLFAICSKTAQALQNAFSALNEAEKNYEEINIKNISLIIRRNVLIIEVIISAIFTFHTGIKSVFFAAIYYRDSENRKIMQGIEAAKAQQELEEELHQDIDILIGQAQKLLDAFPDDAPQLFQLFSIKTIEDAGRHIVYDRRFADDDRDDDLQLFLKDFH